MTINSQSNDREWLENLQPEYREFAQRVYTLAAEEYDHGQKDVVAVMKEMSTDDKLAGVFAPAVMPSIRRFVGMVEAGMEIVLAKRKRRRDG